MDLNFPTASSLAIIDRKIEGIEENLAPAQYEIIRQVVYCTADFEYASLVSFSNGALAKGAAALTALTPIIVDVPEIQVNIVPRLQQAFGNPVYCCATINTQTGDKSTRAAAGLEIMGTKFPNSIFIIGQDQTAMSEMVNLLQNKIIEPSLAIATPPVFIESDAKQRLKNSSVPSITLNSSKGGANVAAAIFNSLVKLAWQARQHGR